MKKSILLLIISIDVLISTCIAFGFYEQIKSFGFNFAPLGLCLIVLSVMGIFASGMNFGE